ncbi:3-methyl-2-oxobutanoate dehydrogenase, partial [Pseudoalteromonas ruthenica]
NWLLSNGWRDEQEYELVKEKVREQILEALKAAENVATPPLEDLISDVFDTLLLSLEQP